MPFVTQERREAMSLGNPPESVGDLCYLAYQKMIGQWRAEKRWTTVHTIKSNIQDGFYHGQICPTGERCTEADIAIKLAWEVFFVREVMPYEELMAKQNGEI